MVKLSDRLMKLAGEVQTGDRVADIGTDHGLLPIFLYENGIASHVILCDINSGPLEKARENIVRFGSELFDLRQGDGLAPVFPGEADTIIIAGMGGILIADILRAGRETARSAARLVLQPRSRAEVLRRFLRENGYRIAGESLVRERGEICQIITAVPEQEQDTPRCIRSGAQQHVGGQPHIGKQLLEDEISPLLFQNRDSLLVPFLERKIRIEETIVRQITESRGGENERLAQAEERLSALRLLLQKARENQ